jgi:predicted kinase
MQAVRFCPDEWMMALSINLHDEKGREMIEALQWKLGRELLGLGLVIIIEWGTWGQGERDALRLQAQALGAAVELHYLTGPVDVLFDRIRRRDREEPPIEREVLLKWSEAFQAPDHGEMARYDKVVLVEIEASMSSG